MILCVFYVVPISLPITLYCFLFLQHFLRCHINFFNTGGLIAKAHVNNLEGVRRNSRVTRGSSNKVGIQSECICCATQSHCQGVKWCVLKLSEKYEFTQYKKHLFHTEFTGENINMNSLNISFTLPKLNFYRDKTTNYIITCIFMYIK